ncbi:hypothetical protein [Bosea sp. (in: a-proteobacteria)]|uniref:hypothetical protein n=1 Tax=Bosea sp. (in: a-proteobacteria) TaxID=1871050 RepID=UPI0027324296|nr:hypothetical protein [Bosea sp. (in: a-proteobacteria)]MDP3411405.1 hypothetical protein [Bosea sp. (in: a-proteobacteria)]
MIVLIRVGLAAFMVLPVTEVAAQDKTVPIRFKPGATAATIKGAIRGDRGVNYTVEAAAGQTLQLLLSPSNLSCYMNVYAPGAEEAVHIGSTAGHEFRQGTTQAGTYRTQVYLMRNAARRNERCRYTLSIELTGKPGGTSVGVPDPTLRARCIGEAAPMYGVAPRQIALARVVQPSAEGGYQIDGTANKGREGLKKLRCLFTADRRFDRVMAMTPDGR